MKRSLLSILCGMLLVSFSFSASRGPVRVCPDRSFVADTIKTSSFTFHAGNRITTAKTPAGIKSLLDTIRSFPISSYILITRIAKDKWVIETQPKAADVANYDPKKVILLEDNVRIMKVNYDKKYAVIME
ncbi:MAG TPA: hypothetical protein VL490_00415 [Mucilaginibacter sp.]|nr:hypothetical protein [Mucilaginibacter sp.]